LRHSFSFKYFFSVFGLPVAGNHYWSGKGSQGVAIYLQIL
jgi:hypothetical protein